MCVQRFDVSQFCNSHYVSHFAAFFIVARAKISIDKSCVFTILADRRGCTQRCFLVGRGGTSSEPQVSRPANPKRRTAARVNAQCLRPARQDAAKRPSKREHRWRVADRSRRLPRETGPKTQFARVRVERPVMILPQVHLRKPCYDFSFL